MEGLYLLDKPTAKTTSSRSHDLILFDLDGTLSDPLQGIACSINYALSHCGYETSEVSQLGRYVGPPIDVAFAEIIGSTDKSLITALITKYRERYSAIGFSENLLYPGICEALEGLREAGFPLAVCTSKRKDFAEKILTMFGLSDLFLFVDGGEIGIHKWQQVQSLRTQGLVTSSSIMIGDRASDLVAAHRNGLTGAGVLWGYGDLPELQAERPRHLFRSPSEWSSLE